VARYRADKSALARLHLPAIREELEPLIMRALVGICGVTGLEMLYWPGPATGPGQHRPDRPRRGTLENPGTTG